LEDFISEPYEEFCERMSDDGVYADHVVVESTAKMLKRDIVVTTSSHENKQIKIKGSNKPDDDETPLLVGHIPCTWMTSAEIKKTEIEIWLSAFKHTETHFLVFAVE
jgi:SOS-response transcriptional repressor LexA